MGTHDEVRKLRQQLEKLEEADNKNKENIKIMCSHYYTVLEKIEELKNLAEEPYNNFWIKPQKEQDK